MPVEKCTASVGETVSLGRSPSLFSILAVTSLGTPGVVATSRRKTFKPLSGLVTVMLKSLWMINSHTLSFIAYNTEARFQNVMAAFMSMGKGMVVIMKYTLNVADSLSDNSLFCCKNCCKS